MPSLSSRENNEVEILSQQLKLYILIILNVFGCENKTLQQRHGKSLSMYSESWTKMKFSIKDFFSKCEQIHSFLRLMENFIFWVM